MAETPPPNLAEQANDPHEQRAADQVFDEVYQVFADTAKNSPARRREFIDGREVIVDANPSVEFVRKRFEDATDKITPLAQRGVRPKEVRDRFAADIQAEANLAYHGSPAGMAMRLERGERLTRTFLDRARTMFADGEADGLTIKTFFERIDGLKYGLSMGYNDLVKKTDEPVPDGAANQRYVAGIAQEFGHKPDVEQRTIFTHINVNQHRDTQEYTTNRYYISPKLNAEPAEVIKEWNSALADLGVDEKVYYKVASGLAYRYDTVAIYATAQTEPDIQQALKNFTQRCPSELLSDTAMPSGVALDKGVTRAPEPHQLNLLLRYRGKETISYNELACALTELALQRASYELAQQGAQPEAITPRVLAAKAKPYFAQFVTLSGIDPDTLQNL
ncbi:MAG: hypothetical protein ACQR33_03925 [Candidatus Saccharibacteria bacterium]